MKGMIRRDGRVTKGVFVILLSLGGVGCESVKPWQRGTLAKSHMAPQPFGSQAEFREHIYGSRESAGGSTASTGGGGCGCY
ncbi:MAG: hypothetical protein RLZZ627_792 [Pseudomonadota bacterium]|jgi:hypothetical protein